MANTTNDQRALSASGLLGFSPGQLVLWHCTPRGGWCIPFWVRARVVSVGKSRITIMAQLKDGGEKQALVKAENLRPRNT